MMRRRGGSLALLTAMAPVVPAAGERIDCGRASTAVERAVCGSATLQAKDRAVARYYGWLLAGASAGARGAFVALQRGWLRERDAAFAREPTVGRLIDLYDERLKALVEYDGDAGGRGGAGGATPAPSVPHVLRGRWRAGVFRDGDGDAVVPARGGAVAMPGELVSADEAGICVERGDGKRRCEPVGWTKATVRDLPDAARYGRELRLRSERAVLIGYRATGAEAPVLLLPASSGGMEAAVAACRAGGKGCQDVIQAWMPVGSGA